MGVSRFYFSSDSILDYEQILKVVVDNYTRLDYIKRYLVPKGIYTLLFFQQKRLGKKETPYKGGDKRLSSEK